jgi:hypothetical protein
MFTILLLAAAAQTNPVADHMFAARDAYRTCVTTQTVRLGAGNQETAETVLRAVRSLCAPQWDSLLVAFPGAELGGSAADMHDSVTSAWRRQAEDAAVAALLEARARRP